MKKIITDQRETLFTVLKNEKIIDREVLEDYKRAMESRLIKVITGPRRAGKSILSLQMLKGREFAYINFDDERLFNLKAENLNIVLEAFYELYGEVNTIFLDEVQNIPGWELFVNRLHRQGINIVVTGSNAHLLSQELSTHLTGRHYSCAVYPFSFREYLSYMNNAAYSIDSLSTKESAEIKRSLQNYSKWGGFPEQLREIDPRHYLSTLYTSVVTKDVVLRHNIRYHQAIREIAQYLITNFSSRFTYNKLRNIFKVKSVHTVQNYLSHLVECYLLFVVERFSFKVKERVNAPRKLYVIDPGIIHTVSTSTSPNSGRLYENLVALSLLRRQALNQEMRFYYWQDRSGSEVDFVIQERGKITQLIQVCLSIDVLETSQREHNALEKASNELACDNLLIVTENHEAEEKFKSRTITYCPLWKWLLEE